MTYSLTSNLKGIVSIVNSKHSQTIFQCIPRNASYTRHLISEFSTVTDGVVDTVTRLQAGRPEFESQQEQILSLYQNV